MRLLPRSILAVFGAAFLLGADTPPEGKPLPPEALDELRSLSKAMEDIDRLKQNLQSMEKEWFYRCMRAVGHTHFCKCLNRNRPFVLDFPSFMRITTMTKEEVEYGKLSKDDRSVYDSAMKARNTCVTEAQFR